MLKCPHDSNAVNIDAQSRKTDGKMLGAFSITKVALAWFQCLFMESRNVTLVTAGCCIVSGMCSRINFLHAYLAFLT